MAAEPLFREEQRLSLARLRILTALPPAVMLLLAIWQVGLGHKWGKQPMSNAGIIGWTIFLWLIYVRLITVKLVTKVFPGELRVAMRGLWRSARVGLDKVQSVRVVTVDPAHDWGGYGVRTSRRGRAYLAIGNEGVELEMSGGGVVVVGSRRAAELARVIGAEIARRGS